MIFMTVTANIIWLAKPKDIETVTLSNTSEYRDLETCDFCSKCNNLTAD